MDRCDLCAYKQCTMKESEERKQICKEENFFKRDIAGFTVLKLKEIK